MVALGIQYKIVLSCHFNLIWRENGGQSTGLRRCYGARKASCLLQWIFIHSRQEGTGWSGLLEVFPMQGEVRGTAKDGEWCTTDGDWRAQPYPGRDRNGCSKGKESWLFNFEQLWKFVCRSVGIRVVVDSSSRHSRSRVSSIWHSTSCRVEHLAFDQLRFDEVRFEELSGSRLMCITMSCLMCITMSCLMCITMSCLMCIMKCCTSNCMFWAWSTFVTFRSRYTLSELYIWLRKRTVHCCFMTTVELVQGSSQVVGYEVAGYGYWLRL